MHKHFRTRKINLFSGNYFGFKGPYSSYAAGFLRMGKISESENGTNDCERVVRITYFTILLTPFFQIL